jgi:drug/metabolite transporter (DMT)-like permease
MVKSALLRSIAAVVLAAGAALAVSGTAVAAKSDNTPTAGDDRAVLYLGDNAVTCEQAHLPGEIVQVTATVDDTYITVTGVPAGVTLTGIVVKGAHAFNVYLPGALGSLPWKNLHSPTAGNSGGPATISHWFACGTVTSSTSKTTSNTSNTSSSSNETPTTKPGSTTTTTPPTMTTTTTAAAVAATTTTAVGTAPLAYTGFSGGWLIIVAAVLLLGGVALIVVPRLRARRH